MKGYKRMCFEEDRQKVLDLVVRLSTSFDQLTNAQQTLFYDTMRLLSFTSRFHLGLNFGAEDINHEITLLKEIMPDAEIIFDVGANAGWWSAIALKHWANASIQTYEPQTYHLSNIAEKVALSNNRINYHALAVSEKIGTTEIFRDTPGSGLASLYRRDLRQFSIDFDNIEMVRTTTLAVELARLGLERIDILKIDVEGHELAVLRGLGERIHDVQLVQFEFGGAMIDSRCFMRDFYRLLEDAGLSRIMRMTPHGLLDLGPYAEQLEGFEMANYVATRP